MAKLLANISKELLLLLRDYTGLLIIFLMPIVLVIVITLVQQNIIGTVGKTKIRAVFLDNDRKMVATTLRKELSTSDIIDVVNAFEDDPGEVEKAKTAVAEGRYQAAIVVPADATKTFIQKAKQSAKNSLSSKENKKISMTKENKAPEIQVYFDPTITESVKAGIVGSLEKALIGIETDEKVKQFSALLPAEIETAARKAMGSMWSEDMKKTLPVLHIAWDKTRILTLNENTAQIGKKSRTPTTVQQNIPAWTLFGMFFVVVPLGGSLIRERQSGMFIRLLTLPMSAFTILAGKIVTYVLICLAQFCVVLAIGKFALPHLGTPVLETGSSPSALVIIALSSAAAACGYGMLLGTIARTYEQSATFGAVSVVIAAALGGIMVPVYVMPAVMQKISLYSPLSWGLNAFLDVFVRGGDLFTVMPEIGLLMLFFLVTTLIAWFNLSRKSRTKIQ